jgi:hypothetical protein
MGAPKSAFRLVQLAADSCSFSKPQLHGFKLFAHTAASKAVDLFEKF